MKKKLNDQGRVCSRVPSGAEKKKAQLKQNVSVVFNLSTVPLSDAMISLLNKGLGFCVKPLKLSLSKILSDFGEFKRKCCWREFFHDKDTKPFVPPLFKTVKTNMPQKHSRPQGLDKFLNAIEVNLQEKSAYNKQHLNPKKSNIPPRGSKGFATINSTPAGKKDCD